MQMTDREKTFMKATLAVVVLLVVYLILRRQPAPQVIQQNGAPTIKYDYYAPYFAPNPGVDNTKVPDNVYNSTINQTINTVGLNAMARNFIPMFGLVGMTAVAG